jgi:glycine cleavage system H protein
VYIILNSDKTKGTIGISKDALPTMGDILYTRLIEPKTDVSAEDWVGAVETTMMVLDVLAPIACRVDSVNPVVIDDPEVIGEDPENLKDGGGWLLRVTVGNEGLADFNALGQVSEETSG